MSDLNFERRHGIAFCFDLASKLLNGADAVRLPKNLLFSEISELDFAISNSIDLIRIWYWSMYLKMDRERRRRRRMNECISADLGRERKGTKIWIQMLIAEKRRDVS